MTYRSTTRFRKSSRFTNAVSGDQVFEKYSEGDFRSFNLFCVRKSRTEGLEKWSILEVLATFEFEMDLCAVGFHPRGAATSVPWGRPPARGGIFCLHVGVHMRDMVPSVSV